MENNSIQDDLPPLERNSDEEPEDESMRNGVQSCSDEEGDDAGDGSDDDWNEMEQDNEPTRCLFCDSVENSIEQAIQHLAVKHHCDLSEIKERFNMDQYSYIKMVNYIRTHNVTSETILSAQSQLWMNDKYLKPVEVEPWLMFDIEDAKAIISKEATGPVAAKSDAHQIEDLQRQLAEKDAVIEHLCHQIEQMKMHFHCMIERTDIKTKTPATFLEPQAIAGPACVGQVPLHEDDKSYFSTYSHYDIHHDMLSDRVRTDSYRDAILKNGPVLKDKLVLDVGCGTSILSMFASKAGAKQVIAIDQSEIIYYAMDIVRKNNISNIQFVKGRLEDTEIPTDEKVDVIISEWMGYFLLFEGMLDSVIYARDHHLKEGGLLLPNRTNISLVALGDEQRHKEFIEFWEDVYGFNMASLQPEVLKEAIVEVCKNEHVLTEAVVIAEFNLMTVDCTCPNFTFDFELKVLKGGKVTAFVGFFDTFFDLPEAVAFSTGPHTTPTHWKQVVFYIRNPVAVAAGEVVKGKFICQRGLRDFRALSIQIDAFGETFSYSLN